MRSPWEPLSPKETLMTPQQHHLNHATWECNIMWFSFRIPEEDDFGAIKRGLGDVFHDLRGAAVVEEGHLMPDHVHMLIYSVAEVIGFMKGKSSIWIAQMSSARRAIHGAQFGLGAISSRRSGGRRNDQGLHQEPRASGSRTGSAFPDPIVLSQVADPSTAFSGSLSYHQLSWWFFDSFIIAATVVAPAYLHATAPREYRR